MDRFEYNRPNTRERVAARRKQIKRGGSAVVPGPRRAVGAWLASGRLASFVLLVGSLLGLVYVFTAPRFAVADMRVEGAQVLDAEAVIDLADARGQSIWFVDTGQIVARLLDNAYVEQASAYVALPDRLVIRVAERRPELRWQVGATHYLVDGSGRVLGQDSTGPLSDTLVIDDRSQRLLQPNDHVDRDALDLARSLSMRLPGELGLQPSNIGWNTDTGIVVTTPDNRTIVFGQSDNLDTKLAVLGTLLRDGTAFTLLDLRSSTPFYRSDGGATPTPGN
ncbi:MAG: FtsQ-type POTRA domain-containing protein [Roseiflexaceae bacterium]